MATSISQQQLGLLTSNNSNSTSSSSSPKSSSSSVSHSPTINNVNIKLEPIEQLNKQNKPDLISPQLIEPANSKPQYTDLLNNRHILDGPIQQQQPSLHQAMHPAHLVGFNDSQFNVQFTSHHLNQPQQQQQYQMHNQFHNSNNNQIAFMSTANTPIQPQQQQQQQTFNNSFHQSTYQQFSNQQNQWNTFTDPPNWLDSQNLGHPNQSMPTPQTHPNYHQLNGYSTVPVSNQQLITSASLLPQASSTPNTSSTISTTLSNKNSASSSSSSSSISSSSASSSPLLINQWMNNSVSNPNIETLTL